MNIAQLIVLALGFGLSQAFRTVPTIMANGISSDLHVGPTQLALFGSAFHYTFAVMQIPVGIALDTFGPRRTVVTLSWLTLAGSLLGAFAPSLPTLIFAQALVGAGCAPALMASMVFISRHWPASRFASISGVVLAAGGGGLLVTSTPLAWVVETWSWRAGFLTLAVAWALVTVVALLVLERDAPRKSANLLHDVAQAFAGLRVVFVGRRAVALMSLGLVSYGATITIRGLWLVPMLVERHGLSLISAGNVALFVSIGMVVAPAIVGRLDPGDARRRWVIGILAYALGLTIVALAFSGEQPAWVDIALCVLFSVLSAYFVLAYSEVRSSYPPELVGRGLTGFNMVMFFGAALAQSISGIIATAAQARGWNGIDAVLIFLAVSLMLGTTGFVFLVGKGRAVQHAVGIPLDS